MHLRVKQHCPLPFYHAVTVQRGAVIIGFRQGRVGRLPRGGAQIAGNGAEFPVLGKLRFPAGSIFQRVGKQVIVGIHGEKHLPRCKLQTMVNGTAFAAVFLPDVTDGKKIFLRLPFVNQFLCPVGGAVVHNEPLKVMEGLPL